MSGRQHDFRCLVSHRISRRTRTSVPDGRCLRLEALEQRSLLAPLAGAAAPFGWAVRTGGSGDDGGLGLTLNQDGSLFVVGYFSGSIDANPGSGNFPLVSSGLQDGFGASYSAAGAFATALGYGSPTSDDQAWAGLPAAGGGAYCALQLGSAMDIVRFDQYGETPWWDWIGGSGNVYVRDMAFGQYGDLYITGQFTGSVDFDAGYQDHTLTSAGAEDVFVLCLATNGAYLWAKSYGGPGSDTAARIVIGDDYSIFIAGAFTGAADFNPSASTNTLTSAGAADAFVAKLDPSGNYLWARGMGGPDSDDAKGLARASDGSLYVAGSFRGAADFDPGVGASLLTAAGGDDAFVVKLDASGNLAWARALRGSGNETARSAAVTANGVCVAGEFTGVVDFNPGAAVFSLTAAPATNSFVCQLTASGLFDGAESFGAQGDVRVQDIAVAADGGIYATGTLVGAGDFDPGAATFNLSSAGGSDLFLAKLPTPPAPPPGRSTACGAYDPGESRFYLKLANSEGVADLAFGFGAPGWKPLAGDWNGDGRDTIGLFQPEAAQFYLRNSNASGAADVSFGYGDPSQGDQYILVMGDWNGDGVDTVGLYHKPSAAWFLRNTNSQGNADITFGFGSPGSAWKPVVGDWDADGIDTIGLYDPDTGMFYLRNSQTTGMADIAFPYGAAGAGWTPLIGDWNGDGVESAGFYQPGEASHFYLRNDFSAGMADVHFGLGFAGVQPIVGDWLGPTGQALQAVDSGQMAAGSESSSLVLSSQSLAPLLTAAIARSSAASATVSPPPRLIVTDLPDAELGRVQNGAIYLDRDAAGHGWFIDPTPAADEEFARIGGETQLTAVDAQAVDKIDLLTVIEHELGHLKGLGDVDASTASLMSGRLPVGVRRSATAAEVDTVFAPPGVV